MELTFSPITVTPPTQTRPPRPPKVTAQPAFIISAVLGIAASIWSYRTHSMLLYGDARAHLNVARRVTDGLRPGPTQLGSVWLPVPHILLVPLVAVRPLWHDGIAGAIVGGVCFAYSAARLFSLIEELSGSRIAAWCGLAVYATNLNLLYLQSTALTEPVLLAFFIGATYHLARWMRTGSSRDLAFASVMTMCATMTRYEGWVVLACGALIVGVWSWRAHGGDRRTEANVVFFIVVGAYGIVLWVLYNLIIFHDPLYFVHSSFSAQSQQVSLAQTGMLGTKGNLGESFLTYGWAVLGDIGGVIVVLGLLSIIAIALTRWSDRTRSLVILLLLAAPVLFNVVSLWLGQTTLRVPQRPPHGMWNDRYGIVALPLLAVAIGLLVGRFRFEWMLALAAAGVTVGTFALGTPLTITDGRIGTSSAAGGRPEMAAAYLHRNYHGGLVLADDSSASPLLFASGLDLKEFVTIGFHPWWEHAIASPGTNVEWAVVYDGDAIDTDLRTHPERFARFRMVMKDGRVRIYQRFG